MKILITADCYTPTINGVVTSILNLETELRRLGHDVKILCPSENFHSSESENVYRIGSVGVGRIYSGARAALRISQSHLQKLIDWKPDIHSQSEFSSFIMAKRIAAEVNCPIVHTYHTVYENYTHYFSPSITLGRKAVILMTKRILRHTKAVIAPSQKIERLLKDYGIAQPIKVIPTGLRLKKFSDEISVNIINELKAKLGIPLKSRVLITVGRAAKEKNIDELIRYFKRLDIENTVRLYSALLSKSFSETNGEPHYAAMKPCMIAEEVLDCKKQPIETDTLIDYKIWCFNGKPHHIWACFNRHQGSVEVATYDLDWKRHDECSVFTSHYKQAQSDLPKPVSLDKMLEIVSKLSCGIPQVRVDLYEVDGKPYFGEMTFSSAGGFMNFYTSKFLREMGDLVDLSLAKRK